MISKKRKKIFIWSFLSISFFIGLIFLILLSFIFYIKQKFLDKENDFNLLEIVDNNLKIYVIAIIIALIISILISIGLAVKYGVDFDKYNSFFSKTNRNDYGGAKFIIKDNNKNDYKTPNQFLNFFPNFTPNREPFWLVRSKKESNNFQINCLDISESPHSITLGDTGSGKTQKIVIPSAILNSKLKYELKPSMVFTDPKGELFKTLGSPLEKEGYEILRLNLSQPFSSSKWNPLNNIYNLKIQQLKYKETLECLEVFKTEEISKYCQKNNIKCLEHIEYGCSICIDGYKKIYIDKEISTFVPEIEVENWISLKQEFLEVCISEEIEDLLVSLIKVDNPKNLTWITSARNVLKGAIYIYIDGIIKGFVDKKKFNLVSIMYQLMNQSKFKEFYNLYKKTENPNNDAIRSLDSVMESDNEVFSTTFNVLINSLKVIDNKSLVRLLCDNDLDLYEIASIKKPTALFLIIPDEKEDKHPLASLFISQLYKSCVFTAKKNQDKNGVEKLDRKIMFFLDEFGNMPEIPNFSTMISVGRSRGIHFNLILQNFEQLKAKYEKTHETIKTSCSLTMYIKSNDIKTLEELSKMLGNETVLKKQDKQQVTNMQNQSKNINAYNKNNDYKTRDLIGKELMNPIDIKLLDKNYGLLIYSNSNPSIVHLEYAYKMYEMLGINKTEYHGEVDIKPINFEKNYLYNFNIDDFDKTEKFKDIKKEKSVFKKYDNEIELFQNYVDRINSGETLSEEEEEELEKLYQLLEEKI